MSFYPLVHTLKVLFTHILVQKQTRVCDLTPHASCCSTVSCVSRWGEVYASLIKSVSHSSGFNTAARMEGGEERSREMEGGKREIVPDLTFLADACNSCAAGSAAPLRRSLHGEQSFHRIILGTPPETLLLLLLFKQYCLQCNTRLDTPTGCIFQLDLLPPRGVLMLCEW